ncbi:MAG: TonB-dependent receptor plug domain-containing protein, partial [Phycisphaeraceae bacterium]|nr:TonB-dependent receptor plug domain-containing protein [Phycisphaeraceae bacterium]
MRSRFQTSLTALLLALIGGTSLTLADPGDDPAANDSTETEATRTGDPAQVNLDETFVTATRTPTRGFESPFTQHLIDSEQLFRRQYRTIPESLRHVPGVMVQKTAFGHGSPYIRGFTSFRNLFLIDGIRLNGPHFRPGPNQYWNTVDPFSIDRLELVKGPSSVMWGSDGIGGTVNAITRRPLAWTGEPSFQATSLLRLSSAEESIIGRQQFAGTFDEKLSFIGGVTGKTFGDLHTGGPVQEGTGYDEWAGDFKFEFRVNPNVRVTAAHYQVRQNNVPRTHKPTDGESFEGTSVGDERQRELDQERDLTYVQIVGEDLDGPIEAYRASLSWQVQEEVRDRIKSSGSRS